MICVHNTVTQYPAESVDTRRLGEQHKLMNITMSTSRGMAL